MAAVEPIRLRRCWRCIGLCEANECSLMGEVDLFYKVEVDVDLFLERTCLLAMGDRRGERFRGHKFAYGVGSGGEATIEG